MKMHLMIAPVMLSVGGFAFGSTSSATGAAWQQSGDTNRVTHNLSLQSQSQSGDTQLIS
jgi:hypothetical protein